MNIIDAIKSGKQFRRPCFPRDMWYEYTNLNEVMYRTDGYYYLPNKTDIIADDWEIKESKVEITASQFWDAYSDVLIESGPNWQGNLITMMARRLGLGDKP